MGGQIFHIGVILIQYQQRFGEGLGVEDKPLPRRSQIIKRFVDRLNESRQVSGYNPLSPAFIASKMYVAGLKSDYLLSWFYGYCDEAKNFSATWWWSLTPENQRKNK